MSAQTQSIPIKTSRLKPGSILKDPLLDPAGGLLLATGSAVTAELKRTFIEREIHIVQVSEQDFRHAVVHGPLGQVQSALNGSVAAFNLHTDSSEADQHHRGRGFDPAETERLTKKLSEATTQLESLVRSVQQGLQKDAAALSELSGSFLGELAGDQDHALSISLQTADSEPITSRSVKLSLLGMALAIDLGLDERSVESVGMAGLIHDWGLYLLPEKLRDNQRPFTEEDWCNYTRHPTLTMDLLERVHNVPTAVRLAAYQVHELCDGSGYPRGLRKERIHLFARILGAVDAYLCFTERRRGRPALVPHDALGCLLHQIPLQRLDGEVVKSLLRVMSLFPLGSLVRLSDGTTARVIRSNPAHYSSPTVARHDTDSHSAKLTQAAAQVTDLNGSLLQIVATLPTPGKEEMQIPKQLMCNIHWDGPDC